MPHAYVYEEGSGRYEELAAVLAAERLSATLVPSRTEAERSFGAVGVGGAVLLVIAPRLGWSRGAEEVCESATRHGVPTLLVAEPKSEAVVLAAVDDWVAWGSLPVELSRRLDRLIANRPRASGTKVAHETAQSGSVLPSSRILPLVVHDLRTPLHVIGLSLRAIQHALPQGDRETEEDFRFLHENFRKIERMLSQLSDFSRLSEWGPGAEQSAFSPRVLVDELLAAKPSKPWFKHGPVELQVEESCPREVVLDPARARLAIHYALCNATTAADGRPVVLTLRGESGRWLTEILVKSPPPPTVAAHELSSDQFERLCGSAAERRGMDLAVAAIVSKGFGGSARLEVDPRAASRIVLDWPVVAGGGNSAPGRPPAPVGP